MRSIRAAAVAVHKQHGRCRFTHAISTAQDRCSILFQTTTELWNSGKAVRRQSVGRAQVPASLNGTPMPGISQSVSLLAMRPCCASQNSNPSFCNLETVILRTSTKHAVEQGFPDGDDAFDATVGLFGMLEVLRNRRGSGEPDEDNVRKLEGWILGQKVQSYG